MVEKGQIANLLLDLGLSSGDSVMLHTSLKKLGKIKDIENDDTQGYCKSIYEVCNNVLNIDDEIGTLAVPTFTHNYVRKKEPFVLEETKSEVGIFTEYVRNLSGTLRTLHPINSVAVRGRNRHLFENISSSGYGLHSFFDRFASIDNSKLVYFGADINHSTFVHHVEHLVGVSYVYNKAYFYPDIIVNNEKVLKTFFNSVRYLGRGIEPDYSILEKRLIDKNLIQIGYLNDFRVMVVGVQDFIEETFRILQENQCALLKDEFYIVE